MKVCKCDVCKKEIGRWYRIIANPMTLYPTTNVSDMFKISRDMDICEDCYKNVFLRSMR